MSVSRHVVGPSEFLSRGPATVRIVDRKLSGVKRATIATAPGKTDAGAPQVQVIVSALDCYDISSVAASMTMSTAQARELAALLIASADKAEIL